MPQNRDDERRQKIRVDFKTPIQISLKHGQTVIQVEGDSKDLSLNGVFVNTDADVPLEASCELEIVLTGMIEKNILKMKGKIVRKEEKGLAVGFESMDLDSYTHLKNIVRYNTEQPDNVY